MHIKIKSGARILEHTSRTKDIQVARIQASIITDARILYDEEDTCDDVYLFDYHNKTWVVSQDDVEVIS